MALYDKKVINYPFRTFIQKRFCDYKMELRIHSDEDVSNYFNYLNTINESDKIKFIMENENKNDLKDLDGICQLKIR